MSVELATANSIALRTTVCHPRTDLLTPPKHLHRKVIPRRTTRKLTTPNAMVRIAAAVTAAGRPIPDKRARAVNSSIAGTAAQNRALLFKFRAADQSSNQPGSVNLPSEARTKIVPNEIRPNSISGRDVSNPPRLRQRDVGEFVARGSSEPRNSS